jgi:hypothetical protein
MRATVLSHPTDVASGDDIAAGEGTREKRTSRSDAMRCTLIMGDEH